MRRGTTPTLTFALDVTFESLDSAYLTIRQSGRELTLEKDRMQAVEGGFSVRLTQEETLSLMADADCRVQLRAISGGEAIASNIVQIPVGRILMDGVIE